MRRAGWVAAAAAGIAVVAGAGSVAAVRVAAAPPAPAVQLQVPFTFVPVPGTAPPVYQPPQGALALQGNGLELAMLHADDPRPIASVAKTMTAYAVLRAHPLSDDAADSGPVIRITDADVADWQRVVHEDGSSLPVFAGEQLTERQMLLGLMLPSANNFADTLARWTSGSVDAFVAEMNRTAQQLGMSNTRFADASGFDPHTVSSARDLVKLADAVLAGVPALMAIAGTQHATVTQGVEVDNLDALLGTVPGWLGIKTGETPQAGGCLLFAARRDIGGATVTVVGAVLGQVDLHAALDAAKTSAESAFSGFGVLHSDAVPAVRGSVDTRWGGHSGVHVAPSGVTVAVRIGGGLQVTSQTLTVPVGAQPETVVALLTGVGPGGPVRWEVRLDRALPGPSAWWMLLHG